MRSSRCSPVGLLLGCLGAFVVVACSGGPEPPPYKAVADNKLLMKAVVDPAADHIWLSVGTVADASGVTEIRPKNDEEWAAVKNAAVTVMESGNLMMMAPRGKDAEWMRISAAIVDKGNELVQAADAKNADKVFVLGGELFDVCTNCHSKYMESIVKLNQ